MKNRDEVRALFRAKKVPLTHQRLAVYEELAVRHDHPSAEALYESLRKAYPSLSLATVYKTLQTLHEMGMVARVDSPAAQARYDAIVETHHHAVCTSCGRIEDLFDPRLDRIAPPKSAAFRFTGHSVHFHGLCAACAKKAGRSPA
ncbi:MAG TPA: transcriptional repressor [Elusimicrobiota bacterium]|jgi:Fur family peroxide stress response transcriptional regulator|nr:transcriptional repressor [Elusimicrobiota bacterium]